MQQRAPDTNRLTILFPSSPGIDSTPGATIAVQHACALASLLSVPDEIALALLPPGAANNTLSSSVAETQPAIQSAVVTFLPKLQMVAQYGLATSPCGASNGSTVACDNYQCFTAAADALLNALALHCASLTLPSSWWSDAAAFAPVLLAKIYGDDPTVSKPEVPTSIQGHSFDWTAIQAAPSDSSIQGTAGGFGFAVPVSGGGVTAYAVAYGDGIVVPLAAAKTSGNGPIKSAALFLASNGGKIHWLRD